MEVILKTFHYFSILFAGGVTVGSGVIQAAYMKAGEGPPLYIGPAVALHEQATTRYGTHSVLRPRARPSGADITSTMDARHGKQTVTSRPHDARAS